MRPGPSQNPNPFSGKKRTHVCWAILLAFAQTMLIFQNFFHDFLPNFLQIWPMFRDFWGVELGPMFTVFFSGEKSTHLGGTFPYILHMWRSSPSPRASCRGTQVILISSIYGMHRYENSATKLWKKCWKGAPFWKGISWNTRVKGHPLSPSARGFAHPEPIGVTPLE